MPPFRRRAAGRLVLVGVLAPALHAVAPAPCLAQEATPDDAAPAEAPTLEQRLEEARLAGRHEAFTEIVSDLLHDLPAEEYKLYGDWYAQRDQHLEGAAFYLLALMRDPELNIAAFRLACSLAAGRQDDAIVLTWIHRAVEAGFWGAPALEREPLFAHLRERAAFKHALTRARARYPDAARRWEPRSEGATPAAPAPAPGQEAPAQPAGGYPVLVSLHGAGDSHWSYRHVNGWAAAQGFVGIAVSGTVPYCADRFRWSDDDPAPTHGAIQAALAAQEERLGAPLDRGRVFLLGFSQGALHALRLVAERPADYAGALAVSPGGRLELAAPTDSERKRPLFLIWGEAEAAGNLSLARDALARWEAAGLPVRAHPHPGAHHFPRDWPELFPRALAWLTEHAGR